MKIKVLEPEYYSKFSCIGPECERTCCAVWRILVEKDVLKRYEKSKHLDLKREAKEYIKKDKKDNLNYIELDENKRCKFLDSDDLCSIQKRFGEKELPWGCRIYPRTMNYIDGIFERGMVLSCPEVSRIVLLNKDKMEFKMFEKKHERIDDMCNMALDSRGLNGPSKYFWDVRSFVIDLIQNRNHNMEKRLLGLGIFVQMIVDREESKEIAAIMDSFDGILESDTIDEKMKNIYNVDETLEFMELPYKKIKELYFDKSEYHIIFEDFDEKEFKAGIYAFYNDKIKPYFEERQYIFENYIINKIFVYGFPYAEYGLENAYSKLMLDYEIFKLCIYILSYKKKEIDEKIIVEASYLWNRTASHNKMMEFHLKGLVQE